MTLRIMGLEILCRFCGKRTRAGDEAMLQARFTRHLRNCNAAKREMAAEE